MTHPYRIANINQGLPKLPWYSKFLDKSLREYQWYRKKLGGSWIEYRTYRGPFEPSIIIWHWLNHDPKIILEKEVLEETETWITFNPYTQRISKEEHWLEK
jgi:hypothetical protein